MNQMVVFKAPPIHHEPNGSILGPPIYHEPNGSILGPTIHHAHIHTRTKNVKTKKLLDRPVKQRKEIVPM